MGKFIKVSTADTFKKESVGVKVEINGDETWAKCTKAVYNYAKNNFKKGDTVNIQYEPKENELPFVTRIEKGDGNDKSTKKEDTTKKRCIDCGAELKDNKYDKCYTCNKKNPSKAKGTNKYSDEYVEGMRKGNILNAVSRSLAGLQGHLEPNNVHEVIKALYKTYDELSK